MELAVATGEPLRMTFLRKLLKIWLAYFVVWFLFLISVLKIKVIVFVINRVTEGSTPVVEKDLAVETEGEATDANKETAVEAQAEKEPEPEDKVHFPSFELIFHCVNLLRIMLSNGVY